MTWSAADISAFQSAFGQPATFYDGSISGVSLQVIFDDEAEEFDLNSGQYIMRDPQLTVSHADVAGWIETGENGTAVKVADTMFRVKDMITTDRGGGFAIITLAEYESS